MFLDSVVFILKSIDKVIKLEAVVVKNQRKYLGEQRFGSYYYYDLKGLDESMKSRLINTNRFPMALLKFELSHMQSSFTVSWTTSIVKKLLKGKI